MYKLISIEAKNIGSFKELKYAPLQGVTTLIFGENKDNASQLSNGSGKSYLIEALVIGLLGQPLREDIKTEEAINNEEDEASVSIVFQNQTEVFTVHRFISRKTSAVVRCEIARDGVIVDTGETVKSSVSEYNKYILEKLGVSKDELLNNFILSKHKYKNFLSSSDKEKKEIINRFSNGTLVDQAIEQLALDKAPQEELVASLELEEAKLLGRIEALTDQIEIEKKSSIEKSERKKASITKARENILSRKNEISEINSQILELKNKLNAVTETDNWASDLECGDESVLECYSQLKGACNRIGVSIQNWEDRLKTFSSQIDGFKNTLCEIQKKEDDLIGLEAITKADVEKSEREYEHAKKKQEEAEKEIDNKARELNVVISDLRVSKDKLSDERKNIEKQLALIENKLHGTISCPKCSHEFVLSDKNFDVEVGRESIKRGNENCQKIAESIKAIDLQISDTEKSKDKLFSEKIDMNSLVVNEYRKMSSFQKTYMEITNSMKDVKKQQMEIGDKIRQASTKIDGAKKEMFNEFFDAIDSLTMSFQKSIREAESRIDRAKSAIDESNRLIIELENADIQSTIESLKTSIDECQTKADGTSKRKIDAIAKLAELKTQEQRFIEFKTYLANTKIEAIGRVTNEFLESIGSDIRIKFSGYTVLKSGKVRDKISISIIRDGIDCGSFGKFSEGEKSRVNLATILAMQKLINSNCDHDKGLDLLVLDEIMEASDETGLACMFSALNSLGITAMVVSHGNVAENYPYRIIIKKENGESIIEER